MDKIETYKKGLEELLGQTIKVKEELRKENKEDESLFEKIKSNVYDIYIKMIYVSKAKGNFVKEYEHLLKKIPENWYIALEKAVEKGDFEQEQIERVKLEAKVEVEALFNKVFHE